MAKEKKKQPAKPAQSVPDTVSTPPQTETAVAEAPVKAQDFALEPVRPGPRAAQVGVWIVPRNTGGDVDIKTHVV